MEERNKSTCREWSRFSTKISDGSLLHMYIEDVSDDTLAEWKELYANNFLNEEPIQRAAEIGKSKEAVAEFNKIKERFVTDPKFHMVVCCTLTDCGKKVIGASAMRVETPKDDKLNFETQSKELTKFFGLIQYLHGTYDVFTDKNVDVCYAGTGIVVHPDYRRLGIAKELIRTRRLIMKEHGLPYTMAWMTASGTQKAAKDDGWETVSDIPYKDLEEKFGVTFVDVPSNCKLMIAKAIE